MLKGKGRRNYQTTAEEEGNDPGKGATGTSVEAWHCGAGASHGSGLDPAAMNALRHVFLALPSL